MLMHRLQEKLKKGWLNTKDAIIAVLLVTLLTAIIIGAIALIPVIMAVALAAIVIIAFKFVHAQRQRIKPLRKRSKETKENQ